MNPPDAHDEFESAYQLAAGDQPGAKRSHTIDPPLTNFYMIG